MPGVEPRMEMTKLLLRGLFEGGVVATAAAVLTRLFLGGAITGQMLAIGFLLGAVATGIQIAALRVRTPGKEPRSQVLQVAAFASVLLAGVLVGIMG